MRLNRLPAARRTNRIAIRHGGAHTDTLTATDAGTTSADGTVCMGIVVPASTRAIRLVFGNCGTTPVQVGGWSYCASASWSDYVNPTGGGTWKRGTFNYGGVRGALPVNLASGQVLTATVPSNGGASSEPGLASKWAGASATRASYYYSDLMPVDTLARTDGGPDRILFVRVLWPQGQSVGRQLAFSGTASTGLFSGHGICASFVAGNQLTATTVSGASAYSIGVPWCWIEAVTGAPGTMIVAGGDSQIEGVANDAFHVQAAFGLTSRDHPIGIVNAGWGGSPPNNWLKHLLDTCDSVKPSLVLMQGFSGNDGLETVSSSDFAEGARFQLQRILAVRDYLPADVAMIVTTPMPRNYTDSGIIALWRAMRAPILALDSASIRVLDVMPICEDPAAAGQWKSGMGDGYGLHPTPTCQGLLAAALKPLLTEMLGLGA